MASGHQGLPAASEQEGRFSREDTELRGLDEVAGGTQV